MVFQRLLAEVVSVVVEFKNVLIRFVVGKGLSLIAFVAGHYEENLCSFDHL